MNTNIPFQDEQRNHLEPFTPEQRPEEHDRDIFAYLKTIYQQKFGIIGLVLSVGLLATLYVHSLEPIYQANTSLLIDLDGNRVSPIKSDVGIGSGLAYYRSLTYFETQIRLLKSKSLADKVVDDLELWKHPMFDPRQKAKPTATYPELAEIRKNFSWRKLLFWMKMEPEQLPTEVNEVKLKGKIVKLLAASIRANRGGETDIIELYYSSKDPKLATSIVNSYAEGYIEMGLDNQLEMMQKAGFWLTEKMSDLKRTSRISENRMQGFLEKNDFMTGEAGGELVDSEITEISSRMINSQVEFNNLQVEYKALKTMQQLEDGELATHPVVMQNATIRGMKNDLAKIQSKYEETNARYGKKHPKMIAVKRELAFSTRQLNKEISNAVVAASNELSVQKSKIKRLKEKLDGLKLDIQTSNRKEFELRALIREVDVNQELYNVFLTKFKETNVSMDVSTSNARVIDMAEIPEYAISPNKKRIVGIASLIALFFAIGMVILLEKLDATLKSGDDVEQRLGLPTLGTLQLLKRSQLKNKTPAKFILEDRKSSFSESIRTIRSGVILSSLDNPHKIVMLTSTVPGEGKTTVAINLALSLSQMEKVLLIDADMRRPSVGKYFEIPKDRPGLSNFVAGKATEEEVVHVTESGLSVISAGVIPPNPSELLSSNLFARHIEAFSERYDKIIIDSAPVQAVSDPIMISKVATGVIFVIKADATPYPLVQAAVKKLSRVRASFIGVVLNQQDTAKSSRYSYYGKYGMYSRYGRYYDSYYHHDYYESKGEKT